MIKKLLYGPDEIRLRDDEDLVALRARIDECIESPQDPWIEIQTHGTKSFWIRIDPSVPIRISFAETKERTGGRIY